MSSLLNFNSNKIWNLPVNIISVWNSENTTCLSQYSNYPELYTRETVLKIVNCYIYTSVSLVYSSGWLPTSAYLTLRYIHLLKDKGVYYGKYPTGQIFAFTWDLGMCVFYMKSRFAFQSRYKTVPDKSIGLSFEKLLNTPKNLICAFITIGIAWSVWVNKQK